MPTSRKTVLVKEKRLGEIQSNRASHEVQAGTYECPNTDTQPSPVKVPGYEKPSPKKGYRVGITATGFPCESYMEISG